MSYEERWKRADPERTQPLRDFWKLFGVPGSTPASSEGEAEGDGAGGGVSEGSVAGDSVRAADQVSEAYLRQGQKMAREIGELSFGPVSLGANLDDLMADTDGVGQSSCERSVTNPGEVVSLWGHMHEFGKSYRLTLHPGTSEELVLLDIPSWSFDWQFGYTPVEQFVLRPGDRVRVECTWDRGLSYQPEPRYITWNEGTEDEMCWTSIATVPIA